MSTSHLLKCHSCGSTDVSVDPPFYRCNHCGSQYRLPEEPLPKKELVAWHRRHRRLLVLLTLLVAVLTAVVLYDTLLLRSNTKTIIPSAATPHKSHPISRFKNLAFSTDALKSIDDLIRTDNESYLIAGRTRYDKIYIAEISASGRVLQSRKLAHGVYVSLAKRSGGGAIVSMYASDQKGETDYLDSAFKLLHKVPEGFKQIVGYQGGFIGVRGPKIVRYDSDGKLLWRRTVDKDQYIAQVGKRQDANGNMVPYSERLFSLALRHLIRLKGGDFVAQGKDKEGRLALVLFTPKGKILSYKKIDLGRLYPRVLYPAKEGGFIVMAEPGVQWIVFDAKGNLIERKRLHLNDTRDLFANAIAEDAQGYIATYMQKGAMFIARVNDDGTIASRHRYALPGVRLHPRKIIPAFDGGFLLAVDTEIHEPWLVKVDSQGRLDADLSDPTLRRATAKKRNLPPVTVAPGNLGDILPTQTHLEFKAPQNAPIQTVPTTEFLGSRLWDMTASPDGQYLYAATGSTGFKIFQRLPDGSVKLLSNLLRTKSKLIISRHLIRVAQGGIPRHGTPEYYDAAYRVVVNHTQTRAYVVDSEHGLYEVDISDKAHPKLLTVLKGVKSVAIALSADDKELYLYDGTLHIWPVASLAEYKSSRLNSPTGPGDMVLLHHGAYLAIAPSGGRREVLIYDTRLKLVRERYTPSTRFSISDLHTDEENNLYITSHDKIEMLHLSQDGELSPVADFNINGRLYDLAAYSKINTLCYATDKGVACLDTERKSPKILYRDAGLHQATALAKIPGSNLLYIAFVGSAIGWVEVTP